MLALRGCLPNVLGQSQPEQQEKGISEEQLFLSISQIRGVWDVKVDDLLKVLPHLEDTRPVFVSDCLEAPLKPRLSIVWEHTLLRNLIYLHLRAFRSRLWFLVQFVEEPCSFSVCSLTHLDGLPEELLGLLVGVDGLEVPCKVETDLAAHLVFKCFQSFI